MYITSMVKPLLIVSDSNNISDPTLVHVVVQLHLQIKSLYYLQKTMYHEFTLIKSLKRN